MLVERYGCLGGMAHAGEVHPFMANHAGKICLDKPIYTDWLRAMRPYFAPESKESQLESNEAAGRDRWISKEIAMLAAEDLCLEAGVDLLYHHTLSAAATDNGAIQAIALHSKSGLCAVKAKIFVDCTGDADLAALAGAPFEEGGPSGYGQPMTLCFKLSYVDRARMPSRQEMSELYRAAKQRGDVDCPREDILFFTWFEDDVVHFNTTRVIQRRATSGADMSAAELEGRRQLRQLLGFFRAAVPGFEQCRIHSIAQQIGVRESRRVLGRAYLTRADFDACAKFEDAIARVNYNIDIHNPDGSGTTHVRLPEGEWYEIPYGCIVPREIGNLLVGGRPISVDHAVHSSMRVMPPACSIGQAAGMAAAMCVEQKRQPAALDGREVRRRLAEQGAFL